MTKISISKSLNYWLKGKECPRKMTLIKKVTKKMPMNYSVHQIKSKKFT